MNEKFDYLMLRAEQLIARIESILPQPLSQPDWGCAIAYRWWKQAKSRKGARPRAPVAWLRTFGHSTRTPSSS